MTSLFQFRVVDRSTDPYFYTNWDGATPVEVEAESKPEALKKVWAVMGPSPRHRQWVADLLAVKPAPTVNDAKADRDTIARAVSAAIEDAYTFEGDLDPEVDSVVTDAVLAVLNGGGSR